MPTLLYKLFLFNDKLKRKTYLNRKLPMTNVYLDISTFG